MDYLTDLLTVLKGDGIALDQTEAALIGAPNGETVSLYAALAARHGSVLARVACAVFAVLIQWNHCANQVDGTPMQPVNYVRATIALLTPLVILGAIIQ